MKLLNMWAWWCELLVVLSCIWLTHGSDQETSTTTNSSAIKIICNDTKAKELDECWSKLPPVKDHGIPSTPQALENACKVFDTGMECVDNWSKACLSKQDQNKVTSSVVGALETYRFLCTDRKFRREFLSHADCYKRISPHWDDCARKFIDSLKRVDHVRDVLSLCCIRFRYIQCVTEVANNFCSKNATRFLQKLAESLVRSEMRTYHPSQCINVGPKNCSEVSSAQSSTKFFSISPSSFLHRMLSYPAKGVINSLNVLQGLAFSDITTFFCALSREFDPYFNHQDGDLQDSTSTTFSIATTTSFGNIPTTNTCSKQDTPEI
ncbi:unnamed protein product [Orchesella dallaii]|uniref:Uncharacterized protein n=2 Tax=Orchesella dallaii TaxID=48710 RepID=A0ABP1RAD2_9HEXA